MKIQSLLHRQQTTGRPLIMAVLNLTPDSFSDGGRFIDPELALARAQALIEQGADIIDLGGESTRPGSLPVPLEQESARVMPVLRRLREQCPDIAISLDTTKPELMQAACEAGVDMINDVAALQAAEAMSILAGFTSVAVCLMHMQGEPRSMQHNPHYEDVLQEVGAFLSQRAVECEQAGIEKARIVLDPGFGFGKRFEDNKRLLMSLDQLVSLGYPVLAGLSRKRMIGEISGVAQADQRLIGSVVAALYSVQRGAAIVRVHDVSATVEAMRCYAALELS